MEATGRGPRWKMHLPEFKPGAGWPSPTPKDVEREQHASILKKTQKHTEKEKHLGLSRGEDDANILELTPESFSLSHSDVSRTDPGSPLGLSDLGDRLRHEEHAFGYPGSRSAQRSLSSSVLEVQRLSPPRRPQLTSTVLYPTYTPRSGHSRPGQTQLRLKGRERETFSPGGDIKGLPMSPHQANYWTCAIPKALPPSPDRHSAGWDPNREYQTLLDYTYPLRPGRVVCEGDGSKLRGDSLLQTGRHLQDSGIELDHLCSSTSLSGLDFSLSAGHGSPDMQGFNKSSEGPDPMDLSLDSLDCVRNEGGTSRSDGHSSTSAAFSRSAGALPSRCACREVDEEFWPLPDQLEELQLLSRRVRGVTAQLSRPVTASWESSQPGTTSILSSITLPGKREAEDGEEKATVRELAGGNQDSDEGKDQTGREDRSAARTAADHRDSGTVRRTSGACVEPVGGGLSPFSLGEVEVLAEQLCGLTLPGSRDDREQSDSLMQHIQVFGSHLEQLIQQLYAVSEKMEQLAAPTVDIDAVKSSLAEYQSFQREESSHQPLTSSVLHTGRLLLGCINRTSPLLRETLLLIERETHTEHFFSSILSAMDSLARPGPVRPSRQQGPVGARGATL